MNYLAITTSLVLVSLLSFVMGLRIRRLGKQRPRKMSTGTVVGRSIMHKGKPHVVLWAEVRNKKGINLVLVPVREGTVSYYPPIKDE